VSGDAEGVDDAAGGLGEDSGVDSGVDMGVDSGVDTGVDTTGGVCVTVGVGVEGVEETEPGEGLSKVVLAAGPGVEDAAGGVTGTRADGGS
jgi:hypothetical protein